MLVLATTKAMHILKRRRQLVLRQATSSWMGTARAAVGLQGLWFVSLGYRFAQIDVALLREVTT
jgi:hypothetical protein